MTSTAVGPVRAPSGRADTLWTLFRGTADWAADETALELGGSSLTYSELLAQAEYRAAWLRTQLPTGRVALVAGRHVETYVGYLAVLRAGLSVVPLNPRFPPAKSARACLAGDVTVILADRGSAALAADIAAEVPGSALSVMNPQPAVPARQIPEYHGTPDDVAYVLFTSGSTGEPKGVPIRHANLQEYLSGCLLRYRLTPGCRMSQMYDLTFDPSVLDMFLAWGSGATLVVPAADEALVPVSFVRRRRITHWSSVPSVVSLSRRMRMLSPGTMPDLRLSLFMGEQLTLDQAAAWGDAAPHSVLENLYGPTELTVTCTGYRLPTNRAAWPRTPNGTVPIGRPYPHLETFLHAVDGDDGELCVRGPQRFTGYLHARDNAGRFLRGLPGAAVPVDGVPLADDWYRTGDQVRNHHGELVHLGRIDNQVKVSGHRVELGEIESVLRGCDGVDEAVVVAHDGPSGIELSAVYTGRPGIGASLRAVVAAELPVHYRPREIHHVDALPMTPNGKTDRRSLARGPGNGGKTAEGRGEACAE